MSCQQNKYYCSILLFLSCAGLEISLVIFNLTFDLAFPPLDDVSLIASGGM